MLIHIGYHKTGTTWLQKKFFQPEFGFVQPWSLDEIYRQIIRPNPFSFDPEKVRSNVQHKFEKAKRKGIIPVVSHERLSGDPFTGGRDSKEIADRLHRLFPDAKVLIVIREQISAIESIYKQYVLMGGRAPIKTFLLPPSSEVHQWFDLNHYCYDALLSYYCSVFGKQNTLIMLYEDFERNNSDFCSRLLKAIKPNCKIISINKSEILHKSLSNRAISLLRKGNQIMLWSAYPLNPNKSWEIFRSMVYRLDRLNLRKGMLGSKIEDCIYDICGEKIKESNKNLFHILGKDFSKTGYKV